MQKSICERRSPHFTLAMACDLRLFSAPSMPRHTIRSAPICAASTQHTTLLANHRSPTMRLYSALMEVCVDDSGMLQAATSDPSLHTLTAAANAARLVCNASPPEPCAPAHMTVTTGHCPLHAIFVRAAVALLVAQRRRPSRAVALIRVPALDKATQA